MSLTRKEWSWVIFIPLLAIVVTMGAFIIYLPAYILTISISYFVACHLPALFNKSQYVIYVVKVTIFSFMLFFAFIFIQNHFMGLYFKEQWGL